MYENQAKLCAKYSQILSHKYIDNFISKLLRNFDA